MPTIEQNLGAIRRMLGHPMTNSPDDAVILQALIDEFSQHTAELGNTNNNWSVDSWVLETSPGTEDYIVTAPNAAPQNFGRPLLVYTVDETEPFHIRCEIPISLLQNADHLYIGPEKALSTNTHTAAVMCFYRKDNIWYVRVTPIPNAVCRYVVWYETFYEFGSVGDEPGLKNFHHLVRTNAALKVLPDCQWRNANFETSPQNWSLMFDARLKILGASALRYQKEFNEYRAEMSKESVTAKLQYGYMSEGDDFGYGRMIDGVGI